MSKIQYQCLYCEVIEKYFTSKFCYKDIGRSFLVQRKELKKLKHKVTSFVSPCLYFKGRAFL